MIASSYNPAGSISDSLRSAQPTTEPCQQTRHRICSGSDTPTGGRYRGDQNVHRLQADQESHALKLCGAPLRRAALEEDRASLPSRATEWESTTPGNNPSDYQKQPIRLPKQPVRLPKQAFTGIVRHTPRTPLLVEKLFTLYRVRLPHKKAITVAFVHTAPGGEGGEGLGLITQKQLPNHGEVWDICCAFPSPTPDVFLLLLCFARLLMRIQIILSYFSVLLHLLFLL